MTSVSLPMYSAPARPDIPPPAPDDARRADHLVDSLGRIIRDLRLSVTDRCNFRCVYCMDPDVRFMDHRDQLTDDELVRVTRICVGLGVRRIRLTGGEPTLHPTLTGLIRSLASLGLDDLAMTTNASLLDESHLRQWHEAGLRRITVSIDSLRDDRFAAITRSKTSPADVIAAIEAAHRVGLRPVKVNVVVIRGFNDDEIEAFAKLARDCAADVRLIEFMPLDSGRRWEMDRVVPAGEMLDRISARYPLTARGREHTNSPATSWVFADGAPGRVGVIATVTRPFCGACSRLRVTADGKVRPCLFSTREWDLRHLLRTGASDEQIARFLADVTWTKQAGHAIDSPDYAQPARPMSSIGG